MRHLCIFSGATLRGHCGSHAGRPILHVAPSDSHKLRFYYSPIVVDIRRGQSVRQLSAAGCESGSGTFCSLGPECSICLHYRDVLWLTKERNFCTTGFDNY